MIKNKRTTLDELLSDPLVQLVMKSDGVKADEVRILFERVAERAELPQPHVIRAMWCGDRLCA